LAAQADYDSIDEILIFNNNSRIDFKHQHPKVKVLNSSHDFGLRSRWILAALAHNHCLVFQDDDILLSEIVFDAFLKMISLDSERAYSLHGRNPGPNNEYSYIEVKGEADIILTRATCIHKATIPLILRAEQRFMDAGYALPPLNGEDIFLSYCLTSYFRKRHCILTLPSRNLPSRHALCQRADHLTQRTAILRDCKEFFGNGAFKGAKYEA
jgi:hypothetical protein